MGEYVPTNPRKLTDEVAARLVEAFELGASQIDACRYAGISDETLRLWLEAGRRELAVLVGRGIDPIADDPALVPRLARLVLCIDVALGEFAMEGLRKITRAGGTDWRAAAWLLERRLPDQWGKREKVDHTHVLMVEVERVAQERGLDPEATEKLKDFVRERERRRSA
jgi:hypothetical protein